MASHEANATGSLCVLEACRRRSVYVVVASSSSVYGSVNAPRKHEDLATRPLSPYAASKLAAEAYLLAYQAAFGLPGLALRFFNVYGPLQTAGHAYAAVIPAFIDSAMRSKPLIIHGDGRQTRDFTFVDRVHGSFGLRGGQMPALHEPLQIGHQGHADMVPSLAGRARGSLPSWMRSMKIHEYQAKAILAQYNVPVPRGEVVFTAEEADTAAKRIGGSVVVKAQIHAGGRGKGGGSISKHVGYSPSRASSHSRSVRRREF